MASAAWGGLPVIGVVARTVTNIQAGGRTPVAGIMHAAFLYALLAFAAPLARDVPLSALAGLVAFVCWRMMSWTSLMALMANRSAALTALVAATFTLFQGSTAGITAGCLAAALLALTPLPIASG